MRALIEVAEEAVRVCRWSRGQLGGSYGAGTCIYSLEREKAAQSRQGLHESAGVDDVLALLDPRGQVDIDHQLEKTKGGRVTRHVGEDVGGRDELEARRVDAPTVGHDRVEDGRVSVEIKILEGRDLAQLLLPAGVRLRVGEDVVEEDSKADLFVGLVALFDNLLADIGASSVELRERGESAMPSSIDGAGRCELT